MTPVNRGEVEAAVVRLRIADVGNGQSIIDGRVAVRALFDRLFAERDEAESRARVCREDVEINAARAEKADAAVMALKRDLASVVLALGSTTTMLEFEAVSHEESGDAKRATYVQSIRGQVAASRAVLDYMAHAYPVTP